MGCLTSHPHLSQISQHDDDVDMILSKTQLTKYIERENDDDDDERSRSQSETVSSISSPFASSSMSIQPSPSSNRISVPIVDNVEVHKDELIITYTFNDNLRALTPNNSCETIGRKLAIAKLKEKLRKKVETLKIKTKNKKTSSTNLNESDECKTTIYKRSNNSKSASSASMASETSFGYGASSITKLTNTTNINGMQDLEVCNELESTAATSQLSSAISSNPTRTTLQAVLSGHSLQLNQIDDDHTDKPHLQIPRYGLQTVQNPFYVSEDDEEEDEISSNPSSYYPSYMASTKNKMKKATSNNTKGVSSYNSLRAQYIPSVAADSTDFDEYYANLSHLTVTTQNTECRNPFGVAPMLNYNTPIYSSDGFYEQDDDDESDIDKLELQRLRSLQQQPPQHSFNYFYREHDECEFSDSTQSTHI